MDKETLGLLLLLAVIRGSASNPPFNFKDNTLTATEGSCVQLQGTFTQSVDSRNVYWIWLKDAEWDYNKNEYSGTVVHSTDVMKHPISAEYVNRVTYTQREKQLTMLICDLKINDSGNYVLRYFQTGTNNKWSSRRVRLSIEENPCPVSFEEPGPVTESQSVTLRCSTLSSCASRPQIQGLDHPWTNLNNIDDKQILSVRFTASWKNNRQQLSCQTEGNTDPYLVRRITLTVKYKPRDTQASVMNANREFGVVAKDNVSLRCSSSGDPAPTYTWYLRDQLLSSGPDLLISSITASQSGTYKCEAINEHGAEASTVDLDVQHSPEVEITATETSIRQGAVMTLKCTVKSKPTAYRFQWKQNGNDVYRRQVYTVQNTQPEQAGSYTCTARNSIGSGTSRPLQIQVKYPPSNLTLSMDTEVTEGQKITISCVVDSFPPSTLTLIRETESRLENMFSNPNSYEPHNNKLVRTFSAASHHTGRYKCRASNTEGSTTSTQRDLVVKYKPKNLAVDVEPRDVKENTSVTFKCAAQSHPPVTSVTWTKSTDGKEEVLTRPQTFTLQSIAPTDSGRYRCRATNEVGSGESPAVDVQVKYAPKEIKIVKAQEQQLPDKRRSVMLTCSTRSYPRIHQYSWYKRSTDDGDVEVSQEQNHTVDSDKPGIYFCSARNEMGEKTSDTVEMFPEGVFVRVLKYLSLSVSLLFIPFAACLIYKYKRRFKREADHPAEKLQEVQDGCSEEESVNYATVHFTNKQPRQDVVYAVVSKPRRLNKPTQDTDCSEEEDEVTYARVTFTDNRPNGKTSKSRRCEEETEYSTVKI